MEGRYKLSPAWHVLDTHALEVDGLPRMMAAASSAADGDRIVDALNGLPCDDAAIERGAQRLVALAESMTQEQMIAAFMMGDRYIAGQILSAAGETP